MGGDRDRAGACLLRGNDLRSRPRAGAWSGHPRVSAGSPPVRPRQAGDRGGANGVAMGGGCEIALACDIVIAAEAVFALPEPRVGLAALAGGLHRLPRAIGWQRAMGMILTGRRVPAAEAHDLAWSTRWCRART
ncbi:enoyl-CoA hydratase-related protein [Sphingomonas sp. MMS24-JH45]